MKLANFALALILIALLALPLAQPAAAGDCVVITIDTLDENRHPLHHIKELCCRFQGWWYCVVLEEWGSKNP